LACKKADPENIPKVSLLEDLVHHGVTGKESLINKNCLVVIIQGVNKYKHLNI